MRIDCAQKGIANPRFKASGLQIRWNGASYLAVDICSYAITGQSIGANVNTWCGNIGVDLKTFSIVY